MQNDSISNYLSPHEIGAVKFSGDESLLMSDSSASPLFSGKCRILGLQKWAGMGTAMRFKAMLADLQIDARHGILR